MLESKYRPVNLEKHDGKRKDFSFEKVGYTERGYYGSVTEATVMVERLDSQGKKHVREVVMAVKQYENTETGRVEHSFEVWKDLRKRAIKTYSTYRLDKENHRVFMTNLNKGETLALASNGPSRMNLDTTTETFQLERFKEIENFDELVLKVLEESLKAAKRGVMVNDHAYFFLVGREEKTSVDFVIGDFDSVYIENLEDWHSDTDRMLRGATDNLDYAKMAIASFIKDNLSTEVQGRYLKRFKKLSKAVKANQNLLEDKMYENWPEEIDEDWDDLDDE